MSAAELSAHLQRTTDASQSIGRACVFSERILLQLELFESPHNQLLLTE